METSAAFELPSLTIQAQKRYLVFAEKLLHAEQQMLTHEGQHILHYLLNGDEKHIHHQHYPKGDRIDKKSGAQYFYHCHRENYVNEEHGHFHCFIRYPNIPDVIKPSPLPDWDKYIRNPMTHLIAISMNRYGKPIRLFTVNRWVSSEIWYDASCTKSLINLFKMTLSDDAYWTILDQWIEALIHLFTPQIIWLRKARDALVANTPAIYDNKDYAELSSLPINLEDQIRWTLLSGQS